MFIGDLNLLILLFLLLLLTFIINPNTSLHMLLIAELLWITLYVITLLIGLIYDNLNLLSFTFFFLIFSAIEFAIGLLILTLQYLLTRSLKLNENSVNIYKYNIKYNKILNIHKIFWKV